MKQTVREAIAFLSRLPAYYTVDTIVVHVEPQPLSQPDPRQLELPLRFEWSEDPLPMEDRDITRLRRGDYR